MGVVVTLAPREKCGCNAFGSVCLSVGACNSKTVAPIRLTRLFYIRNIGPKMTSKCVMTRNDHGERESVISECLVFKCFVGVCQCRYRDYRKTYWVEQMPLKG